MKVGRLTTHVLDTSIGLPGRGIKIDLFHIVDNKKVHLKSTITNSDGRCDAPLLDGENFQTGTYELVFNVAPYFSKSVSNSVSKSLENSESLPPMPFLDQIPIRFSIADASSHYHVPLLVSPWSYSTYRGS